MLIRASRVDHAWARAFLEGYAAGVLSPLVVTIEGFQDYPTDDDRFRCLVNQSLRTHSKYSVTTTATALFSAKSLASSTLSQGTIRPLSSYSPSDSGLAIRPECSPESRWYLFFPNDLLWAAADQPA